MVSAILLFILVLGIGIQVMYLFLMTKNCNIILFNILKAIAWVLVAGASVSLVFLNPQVFRDVNGQACAMVMSLLLPWIVDNFLGRCINDSSHKKLLV